MHVRVVVAAWSPKVMGQAGGEQLRRVPHLDAESLLLRKLRSSFRPLTPPVPSPASCSTSDLVAPPLLWQIRGPSSGQVSVPGAKKSSAYWTQPRASRPDVKPHPCNSSRWTVFAQSSWTRSAEVTTCCTERSHRHLWGRGIFHVL